MRALPLRAAALRVPSHPLPFHDLGAGVPRCGSSQPVQRGEQPELRGDAAAVQVVVVKAPARGAPEQKEGGGASMADPRKSADARCAPPLRDAALRLRPAPPSQPWQPSCAPLRCLRSLVAHGKRGNGAHSLVLLKVPSQAVGSLEQTVPAASQPPSRDASISSSAVRHTPRVRPW